MRSAVRHVLIHGAVAALALACLMLLALSPFLVDWGRELAAGAIALLGVALGVALRERRDEPRASSRSASAESCKGEAAGGLLSPRERDVLRLLAEGLSNKQMARRLNVSENTVKTHLANLYGKLGVNKRVEAVMAAQRLNVGRPEGDHPKFTRLGDGPEAASSAIVTSSNTLTRS